MSYFNRDEDEMAKPDYNDGYGEDDGMDPDEVKVPQHVQKIAERQTELAERQVSVQEQSHIRYINMKMLVQKEKSRAHFGQWLLITTAAFWSVVVIAAAAVWIASIIRTP